MTQSLPRTRLLRWALLCVALSTTGCMAWPGSKVEAPHQTGSRAVGVTTIETYDATRDRTLEIEVWYPSAATETGPAEVYRVKGMGGHTFARLRSYVGAHRNSRVDTTLGPRPVVLLSHGATSSRLAHIGLCELLASHGYIVAAPDHRGHTMADKLGGVSWNERAQAAMNRPLDLSRTLDELLARNVDGRSIFEGTIDPDRVAVAGHSFGGRTAMGLVGARFNAPRQAQECNDNADDRRCAALPVFGQEPYRYRDTRIKAALLITPSGYRFYRGDGVSEVDVPTLIVGARNDHTTPYDVHHGPIYESLKGPRYLLSLDRAGHLTATDVCSIIDSVGVLAKAFGGEEAKDGCGQAYMKPVEALGLVADVALPFLDLHLIGDAGAEDRLQAALNRGNRAGDRIASTESSPGRL